MSMWKKYVDAERINCVKRLILCGSGEWGVCCDGIEKGGE